MALGRFRHGDTDGRVNTDQRRADGHGLADRGKQAVCDPAGLRAVHIAQDDGKLVATEAVDHVLRPTHPGQACSDDPQHLVADVMAVRVVQWLEPIKINKQYRERRYRPVLGDAMKAPNKRSPVRQAGESVMAALVAQLVLALPAFADLMAGQQDAGHLRLAAQIACLDVEPAVAAVERMQPNIADRGGAHLRGEPQELRQGGCIVGMGRVGQVPADVAPGPVTEQYLDSGADKGDAAIRAGGDHEIVGVVEQCLKPSFVATQRRFPPTVADSEPGDRSGDQGEQGEQAYVAAPPAGSDVPVEGRNRLLLRAMTYLCLQPHADRGHREQDNAADQRCDQPARPVPAGTTRGHATLGSSGCGEMPTDRTDRGLTWRRRVHLAGKVGDGDTRTTGKRLGAGDRHDEAAFPGPLGLVHSLVRDAEEMVGRFERQRRGRDADADVNLNDRCPDGDRCAYRFDDTVGDRTRRYLVRAREQDRELVAAEPGRQVPIAQRLDETGRDDPQNRITGIVAKTVVDRLEVVEVDEQQRERRPTATGGTDGRCQRAHEERPVGNTRQCIV